MRAALENYKGIDYVHIASLPAEQRESIYQSIDHQAIINILKDGALLNNCLQYQHYLEWYETIFKSTAKEKLVEQPIATPVLTLSYK